jgi:hypothetical protein
LGAFPSIFKRLIANYPALGFDALEIAAHHASAKTSVGSDSGTLARRTFCHNSGVLWGIAFENRNSGFE